MSNFRGRLLWLSLFMFITILFCGLSANAIEDCDHNYVKIETHEPTCSAEGGTTYQCTECSHTFIGNVKDKLPHTWKTIDQTSPTCTSSGSITERCTVCEFEQTRTYADATGHDFGDYAVETPTCSKEGYTYRICNTCSDVEIVENSNTPKVPHTYESRILTEPTCSAPGYAEYTCTVCSHSYRESVESVDHDLTAVVTAPKHNEKGYTTYTCRFCGLTKLDDFTEPLPYDMEYTINEPTCTENGLKVGVCRDNCQYTESIVLPATGHSFESAEDGGWAIVREATETLDGLEQRVCDGCGLTESRALAYIASEPEPVRTFSPAVIICIAFALILLIGVMVVVLLLVLTHTGRKDRNKYALLTAVDKALAEQKQHP